MTARLLALVWLVLVAAAGAHVATVLRGGLPLQTDLMALVPAEERDPTLVAAKQAMTRSLSQRVVMLVGHADPSAARAAAAALRDRLAEEGVMTDGGDVPPADALARLGQTYFPHRAGLLSAEDRAALEAGRTDRLAERALSQIYGVGGIGDARLLAADPMLLFPAFLTGLPLPSAMALEEGWPTVRDGGQTWVLVSGRLAGEAYALADQDRFVAAFERARAGLGDGVRVLRLGAVFFAKAGATQAMGETSLIGGVSVLGTVALVLAVFRSGRPLVLSLAAIGTGLLTALSASLAWFGTLHATAMMFGAGLIGVAVDYSLHYFCQGFAGREPAARLPHVLPGIALGLATSVIGYAALALSPLPGLHQVAVFSGVGLVGSFLTVVLWFPRFDRMPARPLGRPLAVAAGAVWRLWDRPRAAGALVAVVAAAAVAGSLVLRADDDVRRQQSLDAALAAEQAEVQRLIGLAPSNQFFLVRAPDTEAALVAQEELAARLAPLKRNGAVAGWRGPADFVPSARRQQDDARLVAERLEPVLADFRASLGLAPGAASPFPGPLTLDRLAATGGLPLLSALVLAPGVHVVALDGARDLGALRAAAQGLEGVAFVDPAGDVSALLGEYRVRAMLLLGASALLMLPVLMWRYGARGGLGVMAPPLAAVAATPPLLALFGQPFTFFGAMALVLVLSIGVDYAVFCAEDRGRREPVTVLATLLATLTTTLSFGLLVFSGVAGVRSFGAVMLAGIVLAFLLAPFAGRMVARS